MSQPQLFLGDKPIGYVNKMTTRDKPTGMVRFSQTTELYDRRYRVATLWMPSDVPLCGSIIQSGAATYIYHRDDDGRETCEYVIPYGKEVSIGGLDEAHHAVVAQLNGHACMMDDLDPRHGHDR